MNKAAKRLTRRLELLQVMRDGDALRYDARPKNRAGRRAMEKHLRRGDSRQGSGGAGVNLAQALRRAGRE